MQDALHVGITAIDAVIQLQDTIVVSIATCLVEDAQHHVKTVVDLAMKTRNLNNNAVVRQAIDERVGQTFRHHMIVVVVRLVIDIQHRLLHITHLVPQQIDGHHWQCMTGILHVLGVGIVHAQILAEAQCLRFQPGLLQFYQYQFLMAVLVAHRCAKVDTEHGQRFTVVVAVLMRPHLHCHHVNLQQGRQDGAGDALVLHQILEYDVVNRVCYLHTVRY